MRKTVFCEKQTKRFVEEPEDDDRSGLSALFSALRHTFKPDLPLKTF